MTTEDIIKFRGNANIKKKNKQALSPIDRAALACQVDINKVLEYMNLADEMCKSCDEPEKQYPEDFLGGSVLGSDRGYHQTGDPP